MPYMDPMGLAPKRKNGCSNLVLFRAQLAREVFPSHRVVSAIAFLAADPRLRPGTGPEVYWVSHGWSKAMNTFLGWIYTPEV